MPSSETACPRAVPSEPQRAHRKTTPGTAKPGAGEKSKTVTNLGGDRGWTKWKVRNEAEEKQRGGFYRKSVHVEDN